MTREIELCSYLPNVIKKIGNFKHFVIQNPLKSMSYGVLWMLY